MSDQITNHWEYEEALVRERIELRAEIERLRAALKPFAVELDCMEAQGIKPPPERMLMYASEGGGTFFGLSVRALYDARDALSNQQITDKPWPMGWDGQKP